MEIINAQDVLFLVALNASEESSLVELRQDIERWDFSKVDITNILLSLIEDGTILLSKRIDVSFSDYSRDDSLKIASSWSTDCSNEIVLYLTDSGYKRWEVDDWGISTKRAHYLMFTNQNKGVSRA